MLSDLRNAMTDVLSPLLSIITPTFNHDKYIGPCVESVLSQSFRNWEQIIIDDGSTDGTRNVVLRYEDPRIRYFYQENQGIEALPHTYNRALDLSRGAFIAILEGDDVWPADKLASLLPAFDDPNVVLAYGLAGELSADGVWSGQLTRSMLRRRQLPQSLLSNCPVGSATPYMLSGNDLVPPSTAIIRRQTLEKIGGFRHVPGLCVTDFPTFLRLSLEGTFYHSRRIMGFRRRHAGSVTLNNMDKIITAARGYSLDFVKEHKLQLSASDYKAITKGWELIGYSATFTEGRFMLIQRQWKQARRYFMHSANSLHPRVLPASMVGWLLSWLHCNLEWVFRVAGRAAINA